MKGLLLALMVLAGAAPLTAQRGGRGGPPLSDEDFRPTVELLRGMLDLTPAQVESIGPLRDSLLAATRETRNRAQQAHYELMAARQRAAPADTLAQLQDRMRGAMMALMPYRMQFVNSVKPHLTEQQQLKLEEHHQAMMSRMRGEMGMEMKGMAGRGQSKSGKPKADCGSGECPKP